MSIQETIAYGVIAGVLTSFLIFLSIQIFNKIILPWYKSAIYSGLIIEGSWEEEQEHEGALDISKLTLTQKGQSLKGLMTVMKQDKDTNETEIKNFTVNGNFIDGYVILTGNNVDSKYRGHVTYLLQVSCGGKALDGVTTWVDSGNDVIDSSETTLFRKDA